MSEVSFSKFKVICKNCGSDNVIGWQAVGEDEVLTLVLSCEACGIEEEM